MAAARDVRARGRPPWGYTVAGELPRGSGHLFVVVHLVRIHCSILYGIHNKTLRFSRP